MDKLRLSYFMLNDVESEGNELPDFPGATIVYEVIRLHNGVFLFLDDHIDRLFASAELKSFSSVPDKCELYTILKKTVDINKEKNGNVKLIAAFSGKTYSLAAGFISHKYPSELDYKSGVRARTMLAERSDPNAKVLNVILKKKVDKILEDNSIYEVVYVNSEDLITEGSRSNLFFIKGKTVFTAPSSLVLKGVTRKYVIEACKNAGLELVEKAISIEQATEMDALLITGTSPKVLPVSYLNNHAYITQSELIDKIIFEYENIFNHYIEAQEHQLV